MDLAEEMAVFVAVTERGSFVAAARHLDRSPAAATRAVAALEGRLGVRLFTRTTRAVVLTAAGRHYLEPARRILAEVAALERQAAQEREAPVGTVAVTAPIVFGRLHVLPLLSEFLRRRPSIDVRLRLADEIVPLVDAGIDIGVRIAHLPDSTLKAVRVGSVRRAVYASPAYLAAHGEPATPADLAWHACVCFAAGGQSAERWDFRDGRRKLSTAVAPRLVVNLAEPAIDAAVAGVGLTRVLSYMVDHLVAGNLLRPVLQSYEPPPIPVHVVHPAGSRLPQRTRELLDHLSEGLRARFATALRR